MARALTISSPVFDLDGSVKITYDSRTDLSNITRRTSKTATLDGGSAIVDTGFSDSDRVFAISADKITLSLYESLRYLTTTYSLLICSCLEGCFTGPITDLSYRQGRLTFNFSVKERLSEEI